MVPLSTVDFFGRRPFPGQPAASLALRYYKLFPTTPIQPLGHKAQPPLPCFLLQGYLCQHEPAGNPPWRREFAHKPDKSHKLNHPLPRQIIIYNVVNGLWPGLVLKQGRKVASVQRQKSCVHCARALCALCTGILITGPLASILGSEQVLARGC